MTDIGSTTQAIASGDRRALARAITLIESTRDDDQDQAQYAARPTPVRLHVHQRAMQQPPARSEHQKQKQNGHPQRDHDIAAAIGDHFHTAVRRDSTGFHDRGRCGVRGFVCIAAGGTLFVC